MIVLGDRISQYSAFYFGSCGQECLIFPRISADVPKAHLLWLQKTLISKEDSVKNYRIIINISSYFFSQQECNRTENKRHGESEKKINKRLSLISRTFVQLIIVQYFRNEERPTREEGVRRLRQDIGAVQHQGLALRRRLPPLEGLHPRPRGHRLPGRHLPHRHLPAPRVPLQASQDALRDQDLAPQHQLPDRRHLPRHPQGRVVARPHHPHRPALPAGPALRRRAQRPPGCRGRQRVQGRPQEVRRARPRVGGQVREPGHQRGQDEPPDGDGLHAGTGERRAAETRLRRIEGTGRIAGVNDKETSRYLVQQLIKRSLSKFIIQLLTIMSKRKLQINDIKKTSLRGKKHKTILTKYEVALSYFKQKDIRKLKVFSIYFQTLIFDLLDELTNADLVYKLEQGLQEDIHPVEVTDNVLKVDGPFLKYISKEYPIQQIVGCLSIKKDSKTKRLSLEINKNKLMFFFKHVRIIYPQFCNCVGEKMVVQDFHIKQFYQTFKSEWGKVHERGRMSSSQKITIQICRSLFFVGALIENTIFLEEIEKIERTKKEENAADETKSEKKKNVRGITYQVSSTYSFASNDMLSNFSYNIKSQKSNEEEISKNGFSEKSLQILPKYRCHLWEKAQIGNLKISLQPQNQVLNNTDQRVQVDLLSNDVENILIKHAFKIQKWKDDCHKNNKFDMMGPYKNYQTYYDNPYYQNYQNYQIGQIGYPNYYSSSFVSQDSNLYQGRRSFNFTNLVEVRKTQSRLGGNKYD